jgi:hypothetical protein
MSREFIAWEVIAWEPYYLQKREKEVKAEQEATRIKEELEQLKEQMTRQAAMDKVYCTLEEKKE